MAAAHNGNFSPGRLDRDNAANAPEVDPRYFDMHNKSPDQVQVHVVTQKKLPFGWSLWALLTLAALISALCIGGVVGGILSKQLADCKSSLSPTTTQTSSPESTSRPAAEADDTNGYAPVLAKDIVNLTRPDECASPGGPHKIPSTGGLLYTYYCDFNAPSSSEIHDQQRFLAYTLRDCIDACTNMNQLVKDDHGKNNSNRTKCDSVVFSWALEKYSRNRNGNCWLKTGRAAEKVEFISVGNIYAEAP
ncbi:uncharacterized protein FIESC28_05318 [Fusarium coffeatum]|uniref:Apple domain-containing protein n=1 Tax=Fusarium coffeatum TaxID=231269 RepID=A0A366RTE8_9HYPO|nr:uncharacterized protein FIESC28_05318 [Fusarium coffeatum]RBR20354.1 hypothetical protein FIESC28_05318 [Fusarium coffeatum]